MSAVQLSFSLRVSSGIKTVHLLGSWDNYVGQLPLSKDKSSKSGSWKGTFRFQNSTLEAGQRYWYYYIIDGYHVAHNPSIASTTEPTTGRELNILDVPQDSKSEKSSSRHHKSSSSSKDHRPSSKSSSKSSSRHHSSSSKDKDRDSHHKSSRSRSPLNLDIPKGRPLSMSQIKAPKPMSPYATKHILDSDYCYNKEIEELSARFVSAGIDDEDVMTNFSTSPVSSASGSSFSSRSGSSSPNSSRSGYSTPSSDCSLCTCERYGITRRGERIKIDCGGSRCGYGDDSSDCSYASEDERDKARYSSSHSRRRGVVVS